MADVAPVVDLGFVAACVPKGSHICQVYTDDRERDDALLRFVARGLAGGETTACFSDKFDPTEQAAWFSGEGISLESERANGRFVLSGADAVYFEDGYFDPERMISLLVGFHEGSLTSGCPGARVIGEMSAAITSIDGGSRLLEYEGKVNATLLEHPITAVCQYDGRVFNGGTIMDVLSVHPLMFIHGNVIQNPFFVATTTLARH